MDLDTFPATSAAGSAKNGPVTNNANILKLVINRLDSSDPSAPADGETWLSEISATEYELRARVDGATVSLLRFVKTGNKLKFPGNPDINLKELVQAVLEKKATGDLAAAGAGNDGRVQYDSTVKRPVWLTDAARFYVDGYDLDDAPFDSIDCDLNVLGLAGDAASADTNTRHGGFVMAATKKLNVIARHPIPAGYGDVPDDADDRDCLLEVEYLLAAAETASNVMNMSGTARAITEGDSVNLTGFAVAAVADDIGAATAQYTRHVVRLTLDHDLPASPIAVGDRISVELLRGTAGGAGEVGDIIVTAARLLVPVLRSVKVDE